MECLKCENCRGKSPTYFCLAKNDFVLNTESQSLIVEKVRTGWKKGDPEYEVHRRKSRKGVEA